jgi:hypothetical protein
MTPLLNESIARDRMAEARERADAWRIRRVARDGAVRPTGLHSVRDAVGHGLIAMGERIASRPPASDSPTLRKAA